MHNPEQYRQRWSKKYGRRDHYQAQFTEDEARKAQIEFGP